MKLLVSTESQFLCTVSSVSNAEKGKKTLHYGYFISTFVDDSVVQYFELKPTEVV